MEITSVYGNIRRYDLIDDLKKNAHTRNVGFSYVSRLEEYYQLPVPERIIPIKDAIVRITWGREDFALINYISDEGKDSQLSIEPYGCNCRGNKRLYLVALKAALDGEETYKKNLHWLKWWKQRVKRNDQYYYDEVISILEEYKYDEEEAFELFTEFISNIKLD